VPFTRRNLKRDPEDLGSNFDGAPDLEFRLATSALGLEQSGLGLQRIPPGYRFPYGHVHERQEEVYVVVGGSGRMNLDGEVVELEAWDAVRVPPGVWRGYEARTAWSSSSSARRTSATTRAATWRAGATGGATRPTRVEARADDVLERGVAGGSPERRGRAGRLDRRQRVLHPVTAPAGARTTAATRTAGSGGTEFLLHRPSRAGRRARTRAT
jgi:quercetin dioxygenase-like cupin family protein